MENLGKFMIFIAAICMLLLVVDAYKKARWKAWVCVLFPPYLFYYAFKEFTNEDKKIFMSIWLTCLVLGPTFAWAFAEDLVNHH